MGGASRRAAFSLIELLVVIAIIALLLAMLLPSLQLARMQARRLDCAARLRGFHVLLEIYVNRHGDWPVEGAPGHHVYPDAIAGVVQEIIPENISDIRALFCPESLRSDPRATDPFAATGFYRFDGTPILHWETGHISYVYLAGMTNDFEGTYDPILESPGRSLGSGRQVLAGDRTVDLRQGYHYMPTSNHKYDPGGNFLCTTGDVRWWPRRRLIRHPTDRAYDWYWPRIE